MARLRRSSMSDSDASDSILTQDWGRVRDHIQKRSPQKTPKPAPANFGLDIENEQPSTAKSLKPKQFGLGSPQRRKTQRILGNGTANPLLFPLSHSQSGLNIDLCESIDLPKPQSPSKTRRSPRKPSPKKKIVPDSDDDFSSEKATAVDSSDDDFSDFVVHDSASEFEPRRPLRQTNRRGQRNRRPAKQVVNDSDSDSDVRILQAPERVIGSPADTRDAEGERSCEPLETPPKLLQTSSNKTFDDLEATLKFSPSPAKLRQVDSEDEFVTPPQSPSRMPTLSPTKIQGRIPPSPHRPSMDAFWDQDVTNNWNQLHSPQKTLKWTRNTMAKDEDDSDFPSPSASPRKENPRSPTKKDKATMERKKVFQDSKDSIARAFITELDETATSGQLAVLAKPTGGIGLVWSKKLNSTAGRANWKRESVRTRAPDGSAATEIKHHASIELAEKVIDDEDRLLNVLAHEFCHLANFMVSGVKDRPHGREFKAWAAKVTRAFAHRNIEVTTKHSYAIDYKYVWECGDGGSSSSSSGCGALYKRHSKSIDPARQGCGACKGKLRQIKPAPRGRGGKADGYQRFVKENYNRVRDALPEEERKAGMGRVMAQLAREYKELKGREEEAEASVSPTEQSSQQDVQVVVVVNDSDDEVTRKLDSLSLDK